jgi:nucleoside-diphosphate-sugar epimerase
MTQKALVIGSEGNIGAPLVEFLKTKDYEVREVDIRQAWRGAYYLVDINQPLDLLPAFDWAVVFLLSALVSRATCEQAASLSIATNLAGINNVLQLCKRVGAMTVFFSTSEVYGPNADAMNELTTLCQPNNRYGLSKMLGEKLIEFEVAQYGLRAVTLRPFMIYDESEDFGEHRSAMIRFAYNLALGRPIEVHEGAARGSLHISDALTAVEAAAHVDKHLVVNIGHPHVISISDLAEMIRSRLGASKDLVRLKRLPNQMTLIKRPTLDRMSTILGVTPKVSLEDGVERVCRTTLERIGRGERAPADLSPATASQRK